uniref:VESP-VB2 n=1 Tax=Vespa bicolor TaxID=619325 RepID=VESP2_VESBI|nr:RecName: Full=VESP-VB2; Flags: Precursor [Vespa bicolor]
MKMSILFLFALIASLACLQLTFAAPAASPFANPGASPEAAPLADPLADPFMPISGMLMSGMLGKK